MWRLFMSRFNIFRNPFVDSQVTFLLDTYDQAIRNQTEQYWRSKIAGEVLTKFPYTANIDVIVEQIRNNNG